MKQTVLNMWQENGTLPTENMEYGILSYGKYGGRNEINCNTELWKSNLCDNNDACILVIVTIADGNIPTKVAFSYANAQFNII